MFQVQGVGLVFVEVKVKIFDSPRLSLIGFFPWVLISGVCYAHLLQFISFFKRAIGNEVSLERK